MSQGVVKRPTTTKDSEVCSKQQHWCHQVYETEITEGTCHLPIQGGSDNGEFTYFGDFDETKVKSGKNKILKDNIILEVQGQKVAGYTQRDVVAWLSHCARNGNPVNIKAVRPGSLTKDLRQYLNTRFQKGSLDHDLQNTIRDNLYLRTVPCTTRPQRDGEVNGVDYTFLTPEEFIALERSGNLLESGIYEGNMYGTPRPAPAASALSTALSNIPLHPVTCEHSSFTLINENSPVSSSCNPDVLLKCNVVMSKNMCTRDSLPCECLCDKLDSSSTTDEFSCTKIDSSCDMSVQKIHDSAKKEKITYYTKSDSFSFSESEESTDDTVTAMHSDFSDNIKSHATNKNICFVSADTQTEMSNSIGSYNKEMVDVGVNTDQSDVVSFSNNHKESSKQNILPFLISDLLAQNSAFDLHGSGNLDTFKRKVYRQSLRQVMQRHLSKNSSDESFMSDSNDSLYSNKKYRLKVQRKKHMPRCKKDKKSCTQSESSETFYQTTSKFNEKRRKNEQKQNCNKLVSSGVLNQSASKFQDPFAFTNSYPKRLNFCSFPNIEQMTNLTDNNVHLGCNSHLDSERPLLHGRFTCQNSNDSLNYCDEPEVHAGERVQNTIDKISSKSGSFKKETGSDDELINSNINLLPVSNISLNNMDKNFDFLEHNICYKLQDTCNEDVSHFKDDSSDVSVSVLPSVFVSVASPVASALPGNHYGTPKPHKEPPTTPPRRTNSIGNNSGIILPGAHPSSEGKRRRNRSNVEAMAAKSVDPTDMSDNLPLNQQSNTRSSTPSSAQSGRRSSSNLSRYEDSPPLSNLGQLPENWEKAFTHSGEVYFIDHSSGTSQWLDPRIARVQKKAIEDCEDDELPFGWERIDDPHYGTYYIDHVNRKTQYENPVLQAKRETQNISGSEIQAHSNSSSWQQQNEWNTSDQTDNQQLSRNGTVNSSKGQLGTGETNNPFHKSCTFTSNPAELKGDFIQTSLVKSPRGLGFTIVGGDGEEEEFLQIKSVVPNGPAWLNKKLQTGDILVYVNDICVLGYSHQSMVSLFQSIPPGDTVHLQVCRGYPLPFDPDDPNTEIVTTVAVSMADTRTSESDKMFTNNSNSNAGNVGSDSVESVTRSAKSMPDLSNRHGDQGHPQRHNSTDLLSNSNLENAPDILDFSPQLPVKPEFLNVEIVKGSSGFGFTIADSAYGQKVKKILDRPRCKHLQEGDILVEINGREVRGMPHADVVQVLKECPCGEGALVTVQRGGILSPLRGKTRISKLKSPDNPNLAKGNGSLSQSLFFTNLPRSQDGHYNSTPGSYRSKTPTADLYSSRDKEIISVNRPKTPLVDTRNWSTSQSGNLSLSLNEPTRVQCSDSSSNVESPSKSTYNLNIDKETSLWYSDHERNREMSWMNQSFKDSTRHQDDVLDQEIYNHGKDMPHLSNSTHRHDNRSKTPLNISSLSSYSVCDDISISKNHYWRHSSGTDGYVTNHYNNWTGGAHSHNSDRTGYNNQSLDTTSSRNKLPVRNSPYYQSHPSSYYSQHHNNIHSAVLPDSLSHPEPHSAYCYSSTSSHHFPTRGNPHYDSLSRRKHSTSFEHEQPVSSSVTQLVQENKLAQNSSTYSPSGRKPPLLGRLPEYVEMTIALQRQESGFGFRIVGGTEEGSQVSIGHIVPGGAADLDGRLKSGDEIISVDSQSVVNTSHHHVVQLMGTAAVTGRVTLGIRRQVSSFESMYHSKSTDSIYPYDVTVTRKENEGFGFVIISSVCRAGSTIGRIIENSPAEQCGQLHIGDRILAVNGIGISNMHHGEIVNLIKDSGYSVCLTVGPPLDDASSTASTSQRGEEQVGEQDTEQFYAVELRRSTRGFGFSIRGGKEFQNMPLFVLRIAENGPAHHNNQLQVGDQIIEINGINTKNMTHSEAIELIRQGGNVVHLLVKRGSKVPSNAFDQAASPTTSIVSPGTLSPMHSSLTNGPISQSSPRGQSQNDMQGQENYNWRYELH